MRNSGSEFKKFSQGKQNFEKFKEELRHADSGIDISKIKEEVCKQTRDKVVKEVICNGKTYKDIKTSSRRGDWRIIFTLIRYGVTNPDKILQFLPKDSKAKIDEESFAEMLTKAWELTKQYREVLNIMKESKSKARELLIDIIAEDIIHEYQPIALYNQTKKKLVFYGIYIFNKRKGVFISIDEILGDITREKLEGYTEIEKGGGKIRLVNEVLKEIRTRTRKLMPKLKMRIAFKNGTLEWIGKEIRWIDWRERTPKDYSIHYIPWEIRIEKIKKFLGKKITIEDLEELAKEECPKALETFKKWVGDKWVLLFEIIGYTLYPRNKYKKAFVLVGGTNAGKTTFLNLIEDLVGEDNHTSVGINELLNPFDKFATSELYQKLVNTISETKNYTMIDIDKFKKLIGLDSITADVKYKDRIKFKPYAKLIIATNKPPRIDKKDEEEDIDEALWDRLLIIEFPNKFPKDDEWYEKTFTKDEMEGTLTVGIVAFMRVLQQGRFDFEQTPEEVRDIWLTETDNVYRFIKTYVSRRKLKLDPGNENLWIPKYKLYEIYEKYCINTKTKPVDKKEFAEKLRDYFGITTGRKTSDNIYAYMGIGLVEESEYAG